MLNLRLLKMIVIVSCQTLLVSACDHSGEPTSEKEIQGPESPGIVITNPIPSFVVGQALDAEALPSTQMHNVTGLIRVEDNFGNDNTPSVLVNQQVATVTPYAFAADCPNTKPFLCFQFDTILSLEKGEHTITATAIDISGTSYSQTIKGIVDYCRKGDFDPGIPALFQTDPSANVAQNNRCHEIDGCSVYITNSDPSATSQTRNDPSTINNSMRVSSTAFGSGEVPPDSEYFVHGQQSKDLLPCNTHDVCYQTINGKTQKQCDDQMLTDMIDVCNRAYPGDCPSDLSTSECGQWKGQKETCKAFANSYHVGLSAVGSLAFDQRQAEYKP